MEDENVNSNKAEKVLERKGSVKTNLTAAWMLFVLKLVNLMLHKM